jgi:hypothetical protein
MRARTLPAILLLFLPMTVHAAWLLQHSKAAI